MGDFSPCSFPALQTFPKSEAQNVFPEEFSQDGQGMGMFPSCAFMDPNPAQSLLPLGLSFSLLRGQG